MWTLDVDWSVELEDPTHTPFHKRDNTPPNNNTHINTQHKHHTPPTTPPPPHDEKTAWSSSLFPVEAKPPTRRPRSCKNRLVVRDLVEWGSWMIDGKTESPHQQDQDNPRPVAV